jgi:phospholipase D1/2
VARDPRPAPIADRPPRARRWTTATLLKFLVLPALLAAGFALLRWTPLGRQFTPERLAAVIADLRHAWWAPALLVGGYVALSPLGLPATPLMIAGGVVFGAFYGSLYNVAGVLAGAAVSYFLGRLLGREFVLQVAGKRLKRVERVVARRGFWGLVAVRFLPLPFPLVNYCAALAGVPPGLFVVTTLIGAAPTVTLYTYFFALLARAGAEHHREIYLQMAAALLLLVAATAVPQIVQARRRRARYRELVAARRRRSRS